MDNVLERFVRRNREENALKEDQILRVATDVHKVHKDFRQYTLDARVGGDMNENNKLFKKAQERMKNAVIMFSTCAGQSKTLGSDCLYIHPGNLGAGLGILRKFNDFVDIALVDEASQLTEACTLVPLVKGISQAVLVGDQ